MKPFIRYIKSLWFPVIIVSILSLLTVAGMVLQDTWIFTGTITEQGTHHELIKRGGHYKELYENYAAGMTV